MTRSRTYAVLKVSLACYDEIAQQMRAAGVVTGNDGDRPMLMMGDYAIDTHGKMPARQGRLDTFDAEDGFVGFNLDVPFDLRGLWMGQPARIIFEE